MVLFSSLTCALCSAPLCAPCCSSPYIHLFALCPLLLIAVRTFVRKLLLMLVWFFHGCLRTSSLCRMPWPRAIALQVSCRFSVVLFCSSSHFEVRSMVHAAWSPHVPVLPCGALAMLRCMFALCCVSSDPSLFLMEQLSAFW